MKRVSAAVLTVCLSVLLVLLYSGRQASANQAIDASDLEQIRGMGNCFTMYSQKYDSFPAMTNPRHAKDINAVRAKGDCLSLKLLLSTGLLDDPKALFSPRLGEVSNATIAAMTKQMDPTQDTTFACGYAYDAGHSPQESQTVFFGSESSWFQTHPTEHAHVLNCAMTVKSIEPDTNKKFIITNRVPGGTTSAQDDIYTDDSATFKWSDSDLKWDVPVSIAKK
ncbi:MAG: hypothetical protein ACREJ2_13780 [Planctomycetota bacterium]